MIAAVVLALRSAASGAESNSACPDVETALARVESSHLGTSDALYKSFREFGHCDDGYLAEAYSEAVVSLLAYRWDELRKLSSLCASDSVFRTFVLAHVDSTTEEADLRMLVSNASERCPKPVGALCRDILAAADAALRNIDEEKR